MLRSIVSLLVLVCFTLSVPAAAEAQSGAVDPLTSTAFVVNTGEDIFDAGPLPEELQQYQELSGFRAGFRCDIFGVLFAYIWWGDCDATVYQGDSYYEDAEVAQVVAASYSMDDAQIGWWTRNGRWVLLGLLIAFVGASVLGSRGSGKSAPKSSDDSNNDGD